MAAQPLVSFSPPLPVAADQVAQQQTVRTQFLRRVAHDIASPAGVTMTVLDELAHETKRPELVAMARRGLKRLLRLSEQLALVADLEAGPISLEPASEDLRTIAKEALDAAVAIDGRRDVVTSCDLPDKALSTTVDRRLLVPVLREVIGNALRLASSRVEVELERVDQTAIIRVHDDGPGFPQEVLETLGQRFTSRSCVRGLGLSLSMAKEILAAHGAELHIGASALPPGRRGVRGACVVITIHLV